MHEHGELHQKCLVVLQISRKPREDPLSIHHFSLSLHDPQTPNLVLERRQDWRICSTILLLRNNLEFDMLLSQLQSLAGDAGTFCGFSRSLTTKQSPGACHLGCRAQHAITFSPSYRPTLAHPATPSSTSVHVLATPSVTISTCSGCLVSWVVSMASSASPGNNLYSLRSWFFISFSH